MKYDDASWHSGGNFPAELPPEAGATHTGMFVAWALISGLGGDLHVIEFADDLARLRKRKVTPGRFFLEVCDGKFTDEDLNEEGNAFAQSYFELENGNYLGDYREHLVKGLPSEYHVADTWTSFDKLKPVLDRRLANWRRGRPAESAKNVKVTGSSDLPEDIRQRIDSDFGSVAAPGIASRLAGFIGQFSDRYQDSPDARLLRCVVLLAEGDRKKLEDACRLALSDTRDVIYRAEYDGRDQHVRNLAQPF